MATFVELHGTVTGLDGTKYTAPIPGPDATRKIDGRVGPEKQRAAVASVVERFKRFNPSRSVTAYRLLVGENVLRARPLTELIEL